MKMNLGENIACMVIMLMIHQLGLCQEFQLATPQIHFENSLFQSETKVSLDLDLEGVEIYYAMDSSPLSDSRKKYIDPILIKKDCELSFMANHIDYTASEIVTIGFTEISEVVEIQNMKITPDPHSNYVSEGVKTLSNRKKGSMNFRDGQWIGILGQDVEIEFETLIPIHSGEILIGILQNSGSWIFGPEMISLYTYNEAKSEFLISNEMQLDKIMEHSLPNNKLMALQFDSLIPSKRFKLVLKQLKDIPEWHSGSPENTWIFIDEILLR